MIVTTLALNTFQAFLKSKVLLIFTILFACLLLLMTSPLLVVRMASSGGQLAQSQTMTIGVITGVVVMVSSIGSLLAMFAAAYSVGSELKSGIALPVLARPVERWQYLLGKLLAVIMLMAVYEAFLILLTLALGAVAGQHIYTTTWALALYPLARYTMYAGIALLFASRLHPALAVVLTFAVAVLANMAGPGNSALKLLPAWAFQPLYWILPSPGLLSETSFLAVTQASLKPVAWSRHLIAIGYALDYAVVVFLIGAWLFRRRSLTRG